MVTLDLVAKRYGILPSQLLKVGDSLDVHAASVAIGYENYLHKKAQSGTKDKTDHGFSQDELAAMVQRTKGQNV